MVLVVVALIVNIVSVAWNVTAAAMYYSDDKYVGGFMSVLMAVFSCVAIAFCVITVDRRSQDRESVRD